MAAGHRLDFAVANASTFLRLKLREYITQSGVPALAAVLVRDEGKTIVSGQQGIRKIGASGPENEIQPQDRFPLGSVTKPFTGTLMGKLVQDGLFGSKGFFTTLHDIFPEIDTLPGMYPFYKTVTMEQLLAHVAAMPYNACTEPGNQWLDPNHLNIQNLMQRRLKFVHASVLDKPDHDCSGKYVGPYTYGGGTIICGAMAEKKTGTVWEQLIQQHIFGPLNMTHSGWGNTSPGGLTGPWLHGWDANHFQVKVDQDYQKESANYASHGPAGNLTCSAADLGKYLQEQLIAAPKVTSVETRHELQTRQVNPASPWTRGSWAASEPNSDTAQLTKDGGWGVSYAFVDIRLKERVARGAMSNMYDLFSAAAIYDMMDTMWTMEKNWETFFHHAPEVKTVDSVHPMPAVTLASGDDIMAFGRRHDGAFMRRRSTNGGSSWEAPIEFPAGVFTSGVAACASSDGKIMYVAGRGMDNRIWYGRSVDSGAHWEGFYPIGGGTFQSGAAITSAGGIVHVFATGMDRRMYHSRSTDGKTWSDWTPIGAGIFTSGPAAAASADGNFVHVFGRGTDFRYWRNTSIHAGTTWNEHWTPIGKGVFVSGPAAAASAGGTVIHLVGRGTDRAFWRNKSITNGANWEEHWQQMKDGYFISAPAISTDDSGNRIYTCGLGTDFKLWASGSQDSGGSWGTWSKIWDQMFI